MPTTSTYRARPALASQSVSSFCHAQESATCRSRCRPPCVAIVQYLQDDDLFVGSDSHARIRSRGMTKDVGQSFLHDAVTRMGDTRGQRLWQVCHVKTDRQAGLFDSRDQV